MPMRLAVTFQSGTTVSSSSSTSHAVHCFAALPPSVANSLNEIQPFAALTILRLGRDTGTFHFVAWAGDTTTTDPQSLSLHAAFARSLGLVEGESVEARVVERVVGTPNVPLMQATLRPVVYNDTSDVATVTAAEQFDALSLAAPTLVTSLLQHVRVLYVGLVFPLALPGGISSVVRVETVRAANVVDIEYAVVMPDAEIVIEPPPRPMKKPAPHFPRAFYRAVTPLPNGLDDLPEAVWRSHALLPPVSGWTLEDPALVYVSRKVSESGDDATAAVPALPVAGVPCAAILEGTVGLPPHIWLHLQLTPLTPVLLESPSNPLPRPTPQLFVAQYPPYAVPSSTSLLPTTKQLCEAAAIYFNGMLAKDGVVLKHNALSIPPREHVFHTRDDLWDSTSLHTTDDEKDLYKLLGDVALDEELREQEGGNLSEFDLQRSAAQRRVLRAYRAGVDQKIESDTPTATHTQALLQTHDAYLPEPDIPFDEYPLLESTTRDDLLQMLTMTCETGVTALVDAVREVLASPPMPAAPFGDGLLVLHGPSGAGRTHVCRAAAAVLRALLGLRTIWIRGDVHSTEGIAVSIRRLNFAFDNAADNGPGLLIVDDADTFLSGRGTTTDDEGDRAADSEKTQRDIRARVLLERLQALLNRKRAHTVTVIFSAVKAENLPEDLRAPGFISRTVEITYPDEEERAFLFYRLLCAWLQSDSVFFETDVERVATYASELAVKSDGYSARDVENCFVRAKLNTKMLPREDDIDLVEQYFRNAVAVIETMTPMSRIGVKFSEPEAGDELKWDNIGGYADVKAVIQEALELPSAHPEIFSGAPIRLPRGVLLYGPPGCGKTLLAKTAANEARMRCVLVKGPELMSKYIGESEAEVRRAFDRAAACAPCVLLFDEFDALAPRRGAQGSGVPDRVVNTLLTCMDGAERLADGVYVLATTSRPDALDPALLRPGRLDRWIGVNLPASEEVRSAILMCLVRKLFSVSEGVKEVLREIAAVTDGYTGADLGAIANDAYLAVCGCDVDGGGEAEDGEKMIINALRTACKESRPSLTTSQRVEYWDVMARFGGDESEETRRARVDKLAMEVGKKVAVNYG